MNQISRNQVVAAQRVKSHLIPVLDELYKINRDRDHDEVLLTKTKEFSDWVSAQITSYAEPILSIAPVLTDSRPANIVEAAQWRLEIISSEIELETALFEKKSEVYDIKFRQLQVKGFSDAEINDVLPGLFHDDTGCQINLDDLQEEKDKIESFLASPELDRSLLAGTAIDHLFTE